MGFCIVNDEKRILLSEEDISLTLEKLNSPSLIEETGTMTYDFGTATFKDMYFDGCAIGVGGAHVYENIHIASTHSIRAVTLVFMLHGELKIGDVVQPYQTLEHNLIFNPGGEDTVTVRKQDGLEVMLVSLSGERFLELAANNGRVLDTLADQVAGGKRICLNEKRNHPITARMLMVLDEIRQCRFSGGMKKLYLQSKMIELLALQCEQQERDDHQQITMSAGDKERLCHARDILLAQLQNPPSLQELSRLVGLNEFKLKNGFKQLFDNTVYGYLQEHRMEHAKRMVIEGQQVSVIADSLGFSSIQHFSGAFRKRFGVSPGKLLR